MAPPKHDIPERSQTISHPDLKQRFRVGGYLPPVGLGRTCGVAAVVSKPVIYLSKKEDPVKKSFG